MITKGGGYPPSPTSFGSGRAGDRCVYGIETISNNDQADTQSGISEEDND